MKFNVFWHHSLHSCHLDCIRLTYPAPLRFGRGRAAVASEVTGTGARGPGLILLQILEEELITAPLLKSLCALCQLAVIDLKATSLISIHIWIYAYMCLHIYCVSERKHPIARQRSSTKKCVAIWPLVYFFFFFFFSQRPGMTSGARMPHQGAPMGPPGPPYGGTPPIRPGMPNSALDPIRKRPAPTQPVQPPPIQNRSRKWVFSDLSLILLILNQCTQRMINNRSVFPEPTVFW